MSNEEFILLLQQWANDILVWIGFGAVVGLAAKALMPGPDPGGAIATIAMGVVGVVLGCGVLSYFFDGYRITPVSLEGAAVGTGGAFVILFFYRLLGGYWFTEGEDAPRPAPRSKSRSRPRSSSRRRRYQTSYYED